MKDGAGSVTYDSHEMAVRQEQSFAAWALERAKVRRLVLRDSENPGSDSRSRTAYERYRSERLAGVHEISGEMIVGRIAYGADEDYRIGKTTVTDDQGDVVVLDWRAPRAASFFIDREMAQNDLSFRRTISMKQGTVIDCEDDFGSPPATVNKRGLITMPPPNKSVIRSSNLSAPTLSSLDRRPELTVTTLAAGLEIEETLALPQSSQDKSNLGKRVALRAERILGKVLARERTGRMNEHLATLQPEQFELVSAPLARSLLVEGGPGSGKTVVALHRAAYIVHQHLRKDDVVLVIGPSDNWLAYVSSCLPSLVGSESELSHIRLDTVERLEKSLLLQIGEKIGSEQLLREAPDVAKVKGLDRFRQIVGDFIWAMAEIQDIVVPLSQLWLVIESEEVGSFAMQSRNDGHPYGRMQILFLEFLHSRLALAMSEAGMTDDSKARCRSEFDDVIHEDELLEITFPTIANLKRCLVQLLDNPENLERFAGSHLSSDDIGALVEAAGRRAKKFMLTYSDLDIMTAMAEVVHGVEYWPRVVHLVVDEAQDLRPLQWSLLRGLAGHSKLQDQRFSVTLVGDIAQSVGDVLNWRPVSDLLGITQIEHRSLSIGYRVPGAIRKIADGLRSRLVPVTGEHQLAPSGDGCRFHQLRSVREIPSEIVRLRSSITGLLVVVASRKRISEIAEAFRREKVAYRRDLNAPESVLQEALLMLEVEDVKGLEFDHVVVVDPDELVDRTEGGVSALYVAVSRATRGLYFITVGPKPPKVLAGLIDL